MKSYHLTAEQSAANNGATDLFVLKLADWVKNATTAHTLTALAAGDIVFRAWSEVVTAVAGPTATLSLGVTSAATKFTDATDIATATATPYVVTKATQVNVGTGYIAATSAGAVTTALTDATSGVTGTPASPSYAALSAVNLLATAVLSNVAVTAGEVRIWANISRKTDRTAIAA